MMLTLDRYQNVRDVILFFIYKKKREFDLKGSGIKNLYNLLATEYDSIEYGVSTNLKHKLVFEKIEEISKLKKMTLKKFKSYKQTGKSKKI